ncbi:MAG: phosphoribosyltransferase family protein [Candidatus Acidiferrales bacterium]
MRLHDRAEAGRLLARKLSAYGDRSDVLVLGLPRGGVLVAYGIATALRVPLDILVVRKLGVPGYEEFALGAVATGGIKIIDPDVVEEFHLSDAEIAGVVSTEQAELRRREAVYRSTRPALDLRNQTVILVDDGIATGSTMRAAIEGVKRCGAARVVVAAGVAPLSTSLMLGAESDEVVCLLTPRDFRAVGPFYDEFAQVNDQEVCDVLNKSWNAGARTAAQQL